MQFGLLHVVPALSGFLTRYEQVRVDLLLLDRVVDLVDEGIDLALRIGRLADSMEGGISISENPNLRFDYTPNGAATFRVEATDRDRQRYTGEWEAEAPET